jgi:predicted enzyme related to lactoylglutathione lyase
MESNANVLNWFEIPVTDLKRAQDFYEGIFNMKMVALGTKLTTMLRSPSSLQEFDGSYFCLCQSV